MDSARSLPVTVFTDPMGDKGSPRAPAEVDETELRLLGPNDDVVAYRGSSLAKSSLFPTSMRLRFGDARARASLRKGCSARNDACEVMS